MDFFEKNSELLNDFSAMSLDLGSRYDYVQGGGGNTSVKLSDGLMAIKASGFCLKDITPSTAYAVLDGEKLKNFYISHNAGEFEDVEKSGSTMAKECTKEIDGLEKLRPSVEAGFHSLLMRFVAHTHSVYGNLISCAANGRELLDKAMQGAEYSYGFVKYVNPGAKLTFAVKDEIARVEKATGKKPSVLLMENHGLIANDENAKRCVELHADANRRMAGIFGLNGNDFPDVELKKQGGMLISDTPYLIEALKSGKFSGEVLLRQPLYPDQLVFLNGTLFLDREPEKGTCVLDTSTGKVTYNMGEGQARVIEETLTAVTFIVNTIEKSGNKVQYMGEAAKDFIANWESEKYRKTLSAKK